MKVISMSEKSMKSVFNDKKNFFKLHKKLRRFIDRTSSSFARHFVNI